MRLLEPIAGIEGVASGATATVKVPTNRRLHLLRLFAQATDAVPATVYGADVIDEVQIFVGTSLVRIITAAELLFRAGFEGYTITPQYDGVPIYFSEPKRASVMDEQVTAFDLWNVPDMTLKVKIKSGLTAVTLKAVMVYDEGYTTDAKGNRVLNVIRQLPNFYNAGTSYDITTLDITFPIQRIFLFPASGVTITGVKVVVDDSKIVHELTQRENIAFLEDYGLIAEAGNGKCYPVCFDANGQLFDGLGADRPIRSLRVTVAQSGAGQIKALLESRAPRYI